jgi:peroxiredoxin Q/BCP
VRIAGCSVDNLEAQRAFAEKFSLRYPLIADPGGPIAQSYGVFRDDWKVATRATAVIGEDGMIVKTYPNAPGHGKGHAEEVYRDVEAVLS